MTDLPIYELRDSLARAMAPEGAQARNGVRLVIEAPTGSGKSTQIPRMLLNDGLVPDRQIVVLQPRRIAARLLARRVAQEQGVRLGEEVGYQVRFERAATARTRIRFVTEGILLREMLNDPLLRHLGAIVFDEFHERHLYGDITLARALDVQAAGRPDLALVVMSATLDAGRLQEYLEPCTVLKSDGRTFPVEIRYSAPRSLTEPPWEQVARVGAEVARAAPRAGDGSGGHLLVFTPGGYEIRKTMEALRHEKWTRDFDILPLHGELSPADQDRAVDPSGDGRRRIIVATNVAETSLTIEGVTGVIDSGLARLAQFDAARGLNTLTVEKISKASADQRAGRAGRTAPGLCLRLWSEADHARRPAQTPPEILRVDLAEVVLTLLACGVADMSGFRWLEPPDPKALARAVALLEQLGAVEWAPQSQAATDGPIPLQITPLGRNLVDHPLHPRHARVLEAARAAGYAEEFALLIALLQGRPLFGKAGSSAPARFVDGYEFSDLQPLLRGWEAARAVKFERDACQSLGVNGLTAREAGQLARQLLRSGLGAADVAANHPLTPESFAKALLTGFSDQVARRTSAGSLACDVVGGRRGQIPKESLLRQAPLVIAAEIREVEGRDVQVILSGCTAIEETWLADLFPRDYHRVREAVWDDTQRRVLQKEVVTFRDLVLNARQSGEPDAEQAAALLAQKVMAGELKLTAWDHDVDQWIARLNCLAKWMPELELPALTDEDRAFVIAEMCHGAASYKEIKDRSPWPSLRSWLGPEQTALMDKHAPERLRLADGRLGRITYSESADPVLSARIQQLYDWKETPRIAGGRVPLVLSISGPNQRPLQVTRDLAGFWLNHYPKLKQELARKYPKHEWR
ncbi:MAG: ATP-dependent helicase HrpB [Verrucomicrobiales bacterium]